MCAVLKISLTVTVLFCTSTICCSVIVYSEINKHTCWEKKKKKKKKKVYVVTSPRGWGVSTLANRVTGSQGLATKKNVFPWQMVSTQMRKNWSFHSSNYGRESGGRLGKTLRKKLKVNSITLNPASFESRGFRKYRRPVCPL